MRARRVEVVETVTDIFPGWQERSASLREIIRMCQHDGDTERNEEGVLFCSECGRHLNEDGSPVM